jgi:hypothetical protein
VAWFGWHRFSDPDPEALPGAAAVRDEVVRRIVASFVRA